MGSIEKYKKYFTKEYLMGPNPFRLTYYIQLYEFIS